MANRVSRIIFVVACLCLATLSLGQAKAKRWALVIGIDSYEDSSINSLRYAVADAKLIAKSFTQLGFERVITLTSDQSDANARPTRGSILDRLTQIAELAKPDDTFVFYFSGHGFSQDADSYLTTSDCRTDSLDDTALPMSLLKKKIEKIQASHRVFIVDACRNDPMKGGRAGANVRTESMSKELVLAASATAGDVQPGTAVLWACQLGERSYEMEDLGHGAFTYYLAKGLESGKASEKDGVISPYSLISYAQDQMEAWSVKTGHKQRPDWDSTGKAKFALGETSATTTKNETAPDQPLSPKLDAAECQSQALALYQAMQKQDWKALYHLAAFSPEITKILPGEDEFAKQVSDGIDEGGNRDSTNQLFAAMSDLAVGSATIQGDKATVPTTMVLAINGQTKHFHGVAKMVRSGKTWKWDLTTTNNLEKATTDAMTALIGKPD
ncbi:MAG TPA: caspase family protein [Fimbriimonadaceae bacterium]|nr:caspase family protein [Fimbriimonadaceae bacterium]